MRRLQITFTHAVVPSQQWRGEEHLVAEVFGNFFVDYQLPAIPFSVDVKQTVGEDYETGTLEVGRPRGYSGSLDYQAFAAAVNRYYHKLLGLEGEINRFGPLTPPQPFSGILHCTGEDSVPIPDDQVGGAAW